MRFRLFLLFFCIVCTHLCSFAQTKPAVEQRLAAATTADARYQICFEQARFLLHSETASATHYARQALVFATELHDKRKEAVSADLLGQLADKTEQPEEAISWYKQAFQAATYATVPELCLQSASQIQTLSARVGDYKAAFEWGQTYQSLLKKHAAQEIKTRDSQYEALKDAHQTEQRRTRTYLLPALLALVVLFGMFYYQRRRAARRIRGEMAEKNAMIEEKRRRSEQLLLNILPKGVAAELTIRNKVAARRHESATVMFIDFVGFTQIAELMTPEALIAELDFCFSRFDDLIGRNQIEKIKTVGDAYICASGLSNRIEPPTAIIQAGLKIQAFVLARGAERAAAGLPYFTARIGIHWGPVVAGVVGTKKFAYDIWGDTVNTAARLEQTCEPGRVNVSGITRDQVLEAFQWEYRGNIPAKNKGELEMFYVAAL